MALLDEVVAPKFNFNDPENSFGKELANPMRFNCWENIQLNRPTRIAHELAMLEQDRIARGDGSNSVNRTLPQMVIAEAYEGRPLGGPTRPSGRFRKPTLQSPDFIT